MIKISATVESKIMQASSITGKSPNVVLNKALEAYLEEAQDAIDVKARHHEKRTSLAEVRKELGL